VPDRALRVAYVPDGPTNDGGMGIVIADYRDRQERIPVWADEAPAAILEAFGFNGEYVPLDAPVGSRTVRELVRDAMTAAAACSAEAEMLRDAGN